MLIDSCARGQVEDTARRRLRMEPLTLEAADLQRIESTVREHGVTSRSTPRGREAALSVWRDDDGLAAAVGHELTGSALVVRAT